MHACTHMRTHVCIMCAVLPVFLGEDKQHPHMTASMPTNPTEAVYVSASLSKLGVTWRWAWCLHHHWTLSAKRVNICRWSNRKHETRCPQTIQLLFWARICVTQVSLRLWRCRCQANCLRPCLAEFSIHFGFYLWMQWQKNTFLCDKKVMTLTEGGYSFLVSAMKGKCHDYFIISIKYALLQKRVSRPIPSSESKNQFEASSWSVWQWCPQIAWGEERNQLGWDASLFVLSLGVGPSRALPQPWPLSAQGYEVLRCCILSVWKEQRQYESET